MIPSPLESAESLQVGSVEFVSPGQIKVGLDVEAPDSIALNAGSPRPFPRVNGYVLIPNENGYLVGQIEWLTVEPSPYPKRKGMKDFGLVDLPYPLRKMSLNPLGTLVRENVADSEEMFLFRRGADNLPSVGDPVLVPTTRQLRAIVASGEGKPVRIGTSSLAGDAEVRVDPDRLFGRHLAVLGNTGSGKSCSVAGLIRWSLEAVRGEVTPNARFIILDPNGEYERAFSQGPDDLTARVYRVFPGENSDQLLVPLWFWNGYEWSSFARASGKTQGPLLRRALREVRAGGQIAAPDGDDSRKLSLRRYVSSKYVGVKSDVATGLIQDKPTPFGFKLKAIRDDLATKKEEVLGLDDEFDEIISSIDETLGSTYGTFENDQGETVEFFRAFGEAVVADVVDAMVRMLDALGGIIYEAGPSEDTPIEFEGADLSDHLEILSEEQGVRQYLDFLIMRIRTILSDPRMTPIFGDPGSITLERWLGEYIGEDDANNGCVAIIDLSLVPTEIVHIVTAVVARMIFEAQQRYRKQNEKHNVLPTVLVMEEAHAFVSRYSRVEEDLDSSTICTQVFERIAREGRKFGLGLVLASQRPSELSPTVLSQCNTFLLHRITNDRDQDLVNRYVPDNLKGLLGELPSLPSQHAILLGWATELPVLVRMNDLPKEQRPQSDDPDFWEVWTGQHERKIDWEQIADAWQGGEQQKEGEEDPADTG